MTSDDTRVLTAQLSACAVLARIAWPNENDECQARWAHKVATDKRISLNTYRLALDKSAGNADLLRHVMGAARTLRDYGADWLP